MLKIVWNDFSVSPCDEGELKILGAIAEERFQ